MSGALRALALSAVVTCLLPGAARAELSLGVFAPAADLENTEARIALGTKLAAQLSGGGQVVKARVFVRHAEFEKAKDLSIALVDFAYLLDAGRSWRVVAKTSDVAWRLVCAKSIRTMTELRQRSVRRLLVATGGNDERARAVANGVLHGEARAMFTEVAKAPDSVSALATLALGKAECALAPRKLAEASASLHDELMAIDLDGMPGLVLLVSARLPDAQRQALAAAALTFSEPAFFAADERTREAVVARLTAPARRGPMALAPVREFLENLLVKPALGILHADLTGFIAAPPQLPRPWAPAQPKPAAP